MFVPAEARGFLKESTNFVGEYDGDLRRSPQREPSTFGPNSRIQFIKTPQNHGLRFALKQDGDCESEFQKVEIVWQGSLKMTLDLMPLDVGARVASVDVTGHHGLRLMEMGIVPGAPVRVVKAAPLGDPIHICVHNYHLALRRTEARSIEVILNDEPASSSTSPNNK